ncbi:DUF2171 domain-containing protein [Deinococcus humi]|uniref:DUF2171 domain-containing protein n=1 Tax=Deinococcus humi TaxID=662880 RepID=A0A7W8JWN4_9DEIO|nr:DUF2171 domain-containing protein [Deinococcus humi]MBB5363116.1 hypothetical protein [Deinococcus humi]GGO24601.1 hypothetical protein GCM10008949_13700 [Deinococcus humi]
MELDNDLVSGLPIICADDFIHGHAESVESEYLVTTPMEDGQRHFIPLNVVDHVDDGVYLNITSDELQQLL